jgi:hypothetical protein
MAGQTTGRYQPGDNILWEDAHGTVQSGWIVAASEHAYTVQNLGRTFRVGETQILRIV